jgi:hypothetical protein
LNSDFGIKSERRENRYSMGVLIGEWRGMEEMKVREWLMGFIHIYEIE